MPQTGRLNTAAPINQRSPLSDSLVAMYAIPFGWAGTKVRDLCRYQDTDVRDVLPATGFKGLHGWASPTGGAGGVNIATPGAKLKITGELTIEWFGTIYGTGDTFGPLAYMSYTNGNSSPFVAYGFDRDSAGNAVRFMAGSALGANFTSNILINQFGLFHIVGTMNPAANLATIWLNGSPIFQCSAATPTYATPQLILGHSTFNPTLGPNTSTLAVSIRNRALNKFEVGRLASDAYKGYQDLFNKKTAIEYFVPAPSAGTTYDKTLSIAGVSAIAESGGFNLDKTLTVAGMSALAGTRSWDQTVSVAGVSALTISSSYTCSVTLGSIGSCVGSNRFDFQMSLGIAGVSDFTSPGGVAYFIQRSIEGFAATSQVDGFSYFKSLALEGVNAIAVAEATFQNLVLTIGGFSAAATATQHNANLALAVAGVSAATLVTDLNSVNFLTVAWIARMQIENIYDFLFDTVAIAGFTGSEERFTGVHEEPAAVGSFSAVCTGVFGRTINHILALEQVVSVFKPTAIMTQTLVISQSATYTRVSHQTVTDTLTLTQAAEWSRPAIQTLTLSQTVAVTKVIHQSVTQTLALTHQVARTTTLNRTVSQTLLFNVPRTVTAPIIGSQGGGDQTIFQYQVPFTRGALTPRNCLVILGTPAQSVVLPCPVFGDTQAGTGEINLKRTMTGDTFTYVRRTETEKLKYTFNIGTYKQIELREFLLNHSHEIMTLLNWKGEFWYVFLMNNPTEFTFASRWQPKGERADVTLEFEGIRT